MKGFDVVIPCRNEENNIAPLVAELKTTLIDYSWHLFLINDGSTDGTGEAMRNEASNDPAHVTAIDMPCNVGKQAALLEGFARCTQPLILTMDGDLQDDPSAVPQMLAEIEKGADAVIAVRKRRAEGVSKVVPSRVLSAMVRRRFGFSVDDVNAPMRMVRRELLNGLTLRAGEFRFLPILWNSQGHRVAQVVVEQRPRHSGLSKFSGAWRYFEALFVLLTLPPRDRKTRWWLRILVTMALLAAISLSIDLDSFSRALLAVPVSWVVALGVANLTVLCIRSMRWRMILAGWDVPLGFGKAVNAYLVGTLFGNLTPMHSGAVVRALMVVRGTRGRVTTALASVLVDRCLDLLFLTLVGLSFLGFTALPGLAWLLVGAGVVVYFLVIGFVRVHPERGVRLAGISFGSPDSLWIPALMTIAAYSAFFFLAWLLARASGVNLSPLRLAGVIGAVNIISLVPVTWSGIGAREAAMALFLVPLGVDAAVATAFGVAYSVTFYISSLTWGGIAFLLGHFRRRSAS